VAAEPTAPAGTSHEGSEVPGPASRHALALLRFPDPRTDWVVVTVATLAEATTPAALAPRLEQLHRDVALVGARLADERWIPGAPPAIELLDGEPLDATVGPTRIDRPFDLAHDAPLRLVLGGRGRRLAVIGHHAAFDGLALVAILRALTAGERPEPVASPPPGVPGSKRPLLERLVRPADAVPPTPGVWPGDAYATVDVDLTASTAAGGVTGRIAAAAAAAAEELASRRAAPGRGRRGPLLRKVGLTIAIGGPAGVGNVASYRRIDVAPGDPIATLVQEAMASPAEPGEQVSAPKLVMRALEPVVERFSDTLLISNLGRQRVPGVERIDFFPVARGRSAVCVGSTSVEGGASSLTVRARDLSPGDARRLAASTARHLVDDGR
jgi:hypothetical protein